MHLGITYCISLFYFLKNISCLYLIFALIFIWRNVSNNLFPSFKIHPESHVLKRKWSISRLISLSIHIYIHCFLFLFIYRCIKISSESSSIIINRSFIDTNRYKHITTSRFLLESSRKTLSKDRILVLLLFKWSVDRENFSVSIKRFLFDQYNMTSDELNVFLDCLL